MHKILNKLVWAPGRFPQYNADGTDNKDYRVRNIYRVVLPLTNLAFIIFGVVGFFLTVASIEEAAGAAWQSAWSAGIAISAFLCLVGVAIPGIWAVELFGKAILIGHVLIYVLFQFSRFFDPGVTAFSVLVTIFTYLLIWRVDDLAANNLRPWLRERFIKHDKTMRDSE